MYTFSSVEAEIKSLFGSKPYLITKDTVKGMDCFAAINGKNPKNDIIAINNEDELERLFILISNLVFCHDTEFTYTTVFSKPRYKKNKPFLRELKETNNSGKRYLHEVLKGITTHPIRQTEARYATENIFALSTRTNIAGKDYGIRAADTPEQSQVCFSGNAAVMSLRAFLTLSVKLDGVTYHLPELIFHFDSIKTLLLDGGISEEDLNQTILFCEQMINGHFPPVAQGKQILWPIDDTPGNLAYLSITPLPSSQFMRNLRKALAYEAEAPTFVPSVDKLIGGTKPQNVSDLNSRFKGFNKLLSADLSFIGKFKSITESHLKGGKSLVLSLANDNSALLISSFKQTERAQYEKHLRLAIAEITSPVAEYIESKGEFVSKNLVPANSVELNYIDNPTIPENYRPFANAIFSRLMLFWKQNDCIVNSDVADFSKKTIINVVSRGL